ncbi:MAG: endonuclease [Candidatus Methanoperedens sp.]|nr:endonuclease [Candidatus Methanoperedens sp.]MCE8424982.1 endonuclease [Candidatus Methanoperedens sp.]MCE8427416.1 endonuclease [Candidatus Methanoperedens sp.]
MNLISIYDQLLGLFGHRNWWPAETPFEVVVGAILTQQTKWENVEKAIVNLKEKGLLTADGLAEADIEELEGLVRCTGFYRQKARRLKDISRFFSMNPVILETPTYELRDVLLSLKGIGHETADSIVLYAADKPKFVIDAYTKKMCKCMGIDGDYTELQSLFEGSLPKDVPLYKEFHALIVEYGKRFCGKKMCGECMLVKIDY